MPPTKSNRQFVLIFYLTSFNAIDHCLFLCTFSPCGFDDVILWWFFGSSFLTKLQMLCPVLFLQYFCLTEPHSFCRWFHPIAWTEYHLICWGTPHFTCAHSLWATVWDLSVLFKYPLECLTVISNSKCPKQNSQFIVQPQEMVTTIHSRNLEIIFYFSLSHFQTHMRWVPRLHIGKKGEIWKTISTP